MTPVFEWSKTIYALDHNATGTGNTQVANRIKIAHVTRAAHQYYVIALQK